MHNHPLVRTLFCAALAALPTATLAQDEPEADSIATGVIPGWQMEFENLPRATRVKYSELIRDASRLFNQKRIFESLNRLSEAEAIFESNPTALNLRGACYVEFRDFAQARKNFDRALALQKEFLVGIENLPEDKRRSRMAAVANILFNLAEMDFVTKQWQSAHDRFASLLPDVDAAKLGMIRLIEFKLVISKIKLGRMAEAEELAAKHDFLDDSPFHYYSESALAYAKGDTEAAERWRATARKVFRDPAALAPWEDTMIEADYVKSFYGGDLEVQPVKE